MGDRASTHRRSSGNRTTIESRVQAFKLYTQGFNLQEIADKTGYHVNTIKRYRKEDEWDRRLNEIFDQVLDKVELNLAESLRKTLLTAQTFKHKLLQKLRTIHPSALPVTLIAQLKDIHELEQELIGSLHEVDEDGDLSLYSDEQLEAMLR